MNPSFLFKLSRASTAAICIGWLVGCATPLGGPVSYSQWPAHADDAVGDSACREKLATRQGGEQGLDGSNIRLLNWNVQKGRDQAALHDLDDHGVGSDLVLLQEAALQSNFLHSLDEVDFWSFAPGYVAHGVPTGVLTLSSTMPLARCSLVSYEPWLRTPKATSITQFALAGGDQTLVVVNVHAINFTFGTRRFRAQFQKIRSALQGHIGPIIMSGDFNTWRPGRQNIVDEVAARLDLQPVRFTADSRKRMFGNVLDHVYVRGLVSLESSTAAVTSSDHNPMVVRFAQTPVRLR